MRSISLRTLAIATVAALAAGYAPGLLLRARSTPRASSRRSSTCTCRWRSARCSDSSSPRSIAIQHLRTGDPIHDARSYVSIHLSVIFGIGALLTGAIWAQGPVGRLVGVARADPGQLPDRLPALRDLLPAALLRSRTATARPATPRSSRSPPALSSRSTSSRYGWPSRFIHPRTFSSAGGLPARDAAGLPGLPRGDGAALGHPGPLRARRQGSLRGPRQAAPRPPGPTGRPRRPPPSVAPVGVSATSAMSAGSAERHRGNAS